MVKEVVEGQMLCVAVARNEHEPWMLGRAEGPPGVATDGDVAEAAALGFSIKPGASVLKLKKYDPFEAGSRRYIETKIGLVVP
eukprot:5797771-Prymnesium_polylepis.1